MQEIGGYIELEQYRLPMLHDRAIALNCGRNCLAYLIKTKAIKKILLPYFLCNSVKNCCTANGVKLRYYHINEHFLPETVVLDEDEWIYIVNYYGLLQQWQLRDLQQKYKRVIIDNAQAYFQPPLENVDTLYTCRKFFGVSDGAFLYTDKVLQGELPLDESFARMHFLLGRYERTASEFYQEYIANNQLFVNEPLKQMSKLTNNLLHAIDYTFVKNKRTENCRYLHERLKDFNLLKVYEVEGAYAYPLCVNNAVKIKKRLAQQKIYIPTLWPDVLTDVEQNTLEYKFVQDILPLPCDQRYDEIQMQKICEEIIVCFN